MNKALLCKWLWRYDLAAGSLWREVVVAKYGKGDGWNLTVPQSAFGRSPWWAIMNHSCEFMRGLEFKMGNGRRLKF